MQIVWSYMKIYNDLGLVEHDLVDIHMATVKPGDRVRLTDAHPHRNRICIYRGCESTAAGWGAKVEREDGEGWLYVFAAKQWERAL